MGKGRKEKKKRGGRERERTRERKKRQPVSRGDESSEKKTNKTRPRVLFYYPMLTYSAAHPSSVTRKEGFEKRCACFKHSNLFKVIKSKGERKNKSNKKKKKRGRKKERERRGEEEEKKDFLRSLPPPPPL